MDNEQAKLILGVYRPKGHDAGDPFFADALRQADKDPLLRTWRNDQQQFDYEMGEALAGFPTPLSGKAMIKATMTASSPRRRWLWRLALAASVAIIVSATFAFQRAKGIDLPANASLTQLAEIMSEHHASIGLMTPNVASMREWIAARGGPLPGDLPSGLARLMALGCQTWQTSRGKISLLCFMGDNHQMVHLYVFDNPGEQSSLPPLTNPHYDQVGNWTLAEWRDRGHAYVIGTPSGSGGTEMLVRLLRA